MATVVNLALDEVQETPTPTTSYLLVLDTPYTLPVGNLLVLRSAPDIAPITGTLAVANGDDTAALSGESTNLIDPITGTLSVIAGSDTAAISGGSAYPAITGTFSLTTADDIPAWSGDNAGIVPRQGYIAVTEAQDTAAFSGSYSPDTTGVVAATSRSDTAALAGAFYEYEGPGYLIVDGVTDIAAFSGTNVYDVSGTIAATDKSDIAVWAVKTRIVDEADPLIDTVLVAESLSGGVSGNNLLDSVIVTDILDYSRDLTFVDQVVVDDDLTCALRISLRSTDSVYVIDELDGLVFGVTYDTVTVSETLGAIYTPSALSDVVTVSELVGSTLQGSGALTDLATASDTISSTPLAVAEDTVTATETLVSTLIRTGALVNTVTATETLTSPLTVYAALLDGGVEASDVLLGGLTLVGVLSDTALAGDSLNDAAQTILVVNAETGAVSSYVFTPLIRSMVSYQGVLYLAGPDGLYALDATQDGDGNVVWSFRTGFSNLGLDKLKRVQDANFQARTEGDTTFQVVSDRYGAKQEWNYRLPPLTRDSYRDGVVKVGKGIQSVYWQFAAQGVGPAEIDQMRLVVEPLSRRR